MSKKKATKTKAKKKCSKKERQEAPVRKAPAATKAATEATGLDPDVVARARSYGFTKQQIRQYTTTGALQAACDRCKPPMAVQGIKGKVKKPKARIRQTNQIPGDAEESHLTMQSITPKERIATRNRLQYDQGQANELCFSFVRAHRQLGQCFCKSVAYRINNVPNEKGELVTDIHIVMALDKK